MPPSGDAAICAQTLRQGSRSFAAAALLLPPSRRGHARALYAFCRIADDLIDGASHDRRTAIITGLRQRLDAACAGRPHDNPIDRAFAGALADCAIPHALPEALLEGFIWDAEGRRYADLPALRAYAARVAGTVGAMMAMVLGARDHAAVARACDLGVAMQLSNIARDIGEDAAAGRLYLPLDWMEEAGISAELFISAPVYGVPLQSVIARLLDEAEFLYRRAETGIALLPFACQPAIRAAARLYREIGREVRRRGARALHERAVVPVARKALLIAFCPFSQGRRQGRHAPALAETTFLAHAVPPPPRACNETAVAWTLDLFARLEQREQLRLG